MVVSKILAGVVARYLSVCLHRRPLRNSPRIPIRTLILIVWISAVHAVLMVSARSDFQVVIRTDEKLTVRISGTISGGDSKALQELSAELERGPYFTVDLESKGGDVVAAMEIGRFIRKYEGTTFIGESNYGAKCYSSCALIFIAGVLRLSDGELGLHRPYLASAPQIRQVVEKQVPLMLSQIKQYITEMGITDNFYERMVNTEPSRMATYNMEDSLSLVPERDPVNEEIGIAYQARHYGTTTSEMRKRVLASEECFKRPAYIGTVACYNAALWGVSERAYLERYKKAEECRLRDIDVKFLQGLPRKERSDHPLVIKRETCERSVMLQPPVVAPRSASIAPAPRTMTLPSAKDLMRPGL